MDEFWNIVDKTWCKTELEILSIALSGAGSERDGKERDGKE